MTSLQDWVNSLLRQSLETLNNKYTDDNSVYEELRTFLGETRWSAPEHLRVVSDEALAALHTRIRGAACESEVWDGVITYCAHPLPVAIAHDLIEREVAIDRLGHSRQRDEVQWRLAGFYDEARLTLAIDLYTNSRYSTEELKRLLRQFPTDTWMLDTLSRRTPSSTEKQAG